MIGSAAMVSECVGYHESRAFSSYRNRWLAGHLPRHI